MLASAIRVQRGFSSTAELIAAWPSLKQKSLQSPSALTDTERRLFLDLPDQDMELANITAVTALSRQQLIEKAISDREALTQEELLLLQSRFWTPETNQENSMIFSSMGKTNPEGLKEYFEARAPAYAPNEEAAFTIGITELARREQAKQNQTLRAAAAVLLPDAREWIQDLYRQDNQCWGFVCLYDAAAQQVDPARLELFNVRMDAFFRHALMYNGSKDIIDNRWRLLHFNAPNTAFTPTASISGGEDTNLPEYQDGAILRKAFQEIVKDSSAYQGREDVVSRNTTTQHFKNGMAGSGLLTNTFLVIDPACIDSVLEDGKWYDDLRMLAFEAGFPVAGREYIKGYQGFTWVRMDQLVYDFYELRLRRADEVGMDEIWQAAQSSRHQAFVSMNPTEYTWRTGSCSMRGFTRDSVLGSRWYELRDARQSQGVRVID